LLRRTFILILFVAAVACVACLYDVPALLTRHDHAPTPVDKNSDQHATAVTLHAR